MENFGHYEASFGPLTAAVVLLLWMYNSALILVLGAVVNAELEYETRLQKEKQSELSNMGESSRYASQNQKDD